VSQINGKLIKLQR